MNKVGIACVYFVSEEETWVYELQQKLINKYSKNHKIKIYAAIVKAPEYIQRFMEASPHFSIHDSQSEDPLPNRQHGENLSFLVKKAFEDGCDVAITLDPDSFPCNASWISTMESKANAEGGICAVVREELGDFHLPHPCGFCVTKTYYDKYGVNFYPKDAFFNSKLFLDFQESTGQRTDTGIGVAVDLWKNRVAWSKLKRSNKNNIHDVMAGIYGDIIFHVGGATRPPIFKNSMSNIFGSRLIKPMSEKPLVWRVYAYFLNRIVKKNKALQTKMVKQLKENPEDFIKYLKGH